MSDRVDQFLNKGKNELQEFAVTLSRMIANLAVDPHGYFEKKYAARIEGSESEAEINGVIAQLVQWASSSTVTDSERRQIDSQLDSLGMPTLALLRSHYLP